MEPKGRTGLGEREGAEAGATEVAILASYSGLLAHRRAYSLFAAAWDRGTIGLENVRARLACGENNAISGPFKLAEN
jgi:hypothetical protein